LTTRALFPRRAAWPVAAFAAACLVQGCTQPKPVSGTRLYASDLAGGAKQCAVPAITVSNGQETAVPMTVGNDGGWCGISVAQAGSRPYSLGLLTTPPSHGKIYIHTVGDQTRVDYTPDAGFTGNDSFVVKLVPGSGAMRVAVTVTPRS
jgi:hypothetical protein